MNSYEPILEKLISFAKESELIQAMILFGSRARDNNAADQYSDYDIIFLVTDVDYFLNSDEWLNQIEDYYISFEEPTAASGQERRVFFSDARDMDFLFYDVKKSELLAADQTLQLFFSRGYKLLVDKIDFKAAIERNQSTETVSARKTLFTEKEFINLANTFWFHSIWSMKKLLRGETWAAKYCVDSYMKDLLRQMLEGYSLAVHSKDFDVWHDGRFSDNWVDEDIKRQLRTVYGTYDAEDIIRALNNTMHIFREVSVKTASLLEYAYPTTAQTYALEQTAKLERILCLIKIK